MGLCDHVGQAIAGGVSVGFPYASFLLGATDSYQIGPTTNQHMREKSFAFFAQDTWKVTRRLTLDYGLRYGLRNTRFGTFTFDATASQVIKKGSDAGTGSGFFDNTGLAFDVEWRYNYGIGWNYKKWSARIVADVVGKYFNDNWTTAGWGENVLTIVRPSVTYRGFKKPSITMGVTNVLDDRPPAMGHRALGFDDRVYGAGALVISGGLHEGSTRRFKESTCEE